MPTTADRQTPTHPMSNDFVVVVVVVVVVRSFVCSRSLSIDKWWYVVVVGVGVVVVVVVVCVRTEGWSG